MIRIIDLETTGLEPPPECEVVEIGHCDLTQNDDDVWEVEEPMACYINTDLPIPPEVSAIHHILKEDLEQANNWHDLGPKIFNPACAAFAAHNAKFDRQWCDLWAGDKKWICTYKCALRLWPDAPKHNNQTLRYWLNPTGLDRDIAKDVHRAGPDAYVTAFILREMLNTGTSIEQLVEWSSQPGILPKLTFGKHVGKKWSDPAVDTGYLQWMLKQDFGEDEKFTAERELKRRRGL